MFSASVSPTAHWGSYDTITQEQLLSVVVILSAFQNLPVGWVICNREKKSPGVIPTQYLLRNVVPPLVLKTDTAEAYKSEKSLGLIHTGKEETLITPVIQIGTLKQQPHPLFFHVLHAPTTLLCWLLSEHILIPSLNSCCFLSVECYPQIPVANFLTNFPLFDAKSRCYLSSKFSHLLRENHLHCTSYSAIISFCHSVSYLYKHLPH